MHRATDYLICDDHLMVTRIPHVQQKFHWDCGLACLEMILIHFDKDLPSFRDGYNQFDFGQRYIYGGYRILVFFVNLYFIFSLYEFYDDMSYLIKSKILFYKMGKSISRIINNNLVIFWIIYLDLFVNN